MNKYFFLKQIIKYKFNKNIVKKDKCPNELAQEVKDGEDGKIKNKHNIEIVSDKFNLYLNLIKAYSFRINVIK